ncbi:MAG: GNAT family N-acetyltransferase [Bacteroidales bacterium]|nr:GNAT family N-acetyltransferase [Bacteroidales bacterium]
MVKIVECNFNDTEQRKAIKDLMAHYMSDEMGGKQPMPSEEHLEQMVTGLEMNSVKLVLLAKKGKKYIGLSNCFINFGTFAAKPFINIHDIVVYKSERDSGVGRKLMEAILDKAKILDCSKITLEVRKDNLLAQHLYKSLGFGECHPVMHFWAKYL